MPRVRWRVGPIGLALLTLAATLSIDPLAVQAHSDFVSSSPPAGARVESAPREVRVTFTEAPLRQSSASVTDGCGRDVTSRVAVSERSLVAATTSGRPGDWTVDYTIASRDGHPVVGRVTFRVAGRPECDPGPESGSGTESPGASIREREAVQPQQRLATESSEESSVVLALWLTAGGIAIAALLARFLMRRKPTADR